MANEQAGPVGQFHLKLGCQLKADVEEEAKRLCLRPTDFIKLTLAERLYTRKKGEISDGKRSEQSA